MLLVDRMSSRIEEYEAKDHDSRVERIESDIPTIHTSASHSVSYSKVIVDIDVRIHIPDDRVRRK